MPAIALHVLLRQCYSSPRALCSPSSSPVVLLSATPFLRHSVRQDSLLHMSFLSGLISSSRPDHQRQAQRQNRASTSTDCISCKQDDNCSSPHPLSLHIISILPACRYRSTGLAPISGTLSPPPSTLSANGSLPHATLTKASSCTCDAHCTCPAGCRQ
jgi:hypothetical protein